MGHDRGYGLAEAHSECTSLRRRLRGPRGRGTRYGDRRAVRKITKSTYYKEKKTYMEKHTLKTLDRATPTLQPYFRIYILAPTVGKISFLSATVDPNQTVGTTPSRVNDINPIGSTQRPKLYPLGQREPMAQPEQPRHNESLRSGHRVKIDIPRQIEHPSQNESELESGTVSGKGSQPMI
ncbi:LOW QUALITY PROTEIN: hypothetical protein YC2023_018002 [Brassica napus]